MAYSSRTISDDWEVRKWSPDIPFDYQSIDEDAQWYETAMPRQIHETLVAHGLIEDPCLPGGRLSECMWVAECDWIYRTRFDAESTAQLSNLHFGGIDTLADIYLNGNHIASHEDMFLPLSVPVSDLRETGNELIVHIRSPHAWLEQQKPLQSWSGKVALNKQIRKPHHDFGAYLSGEPYFTNIGLYDDVVLEQSSIAILESVDIDQFTSEDRTVGRLSIAVTGTGKADDIRVALRLIHPESGVAASTYLHPDYSGDRWSCTGELSISDPDLWWPAGYGAQTLYRLDTELLSGETAEQVVQRDIGFRSLHIDRKLSCTVNGISMRLWGANLTPVTGWTHRWISERAIKILDRAELCHMNCLRIWGGGDWYGDELYEEADRRGILLWHDFPNEYGACPDTESFLALCEKEAIHIVKRLRHHPSIMLWCGGNEAHMGNEFDRPGEPLIGRELYEEVYPEVCRRYDPGRYYQANSPYYGAFPNDPTEGDTHDYTTTWYVPGIKHPVFTTENMRVSAPPMRSMIRYVGADQVWPEGYDGRVTKGTDLPWPESWERRTSANSWRKIPAVEQYCDPVDGESLIYAYGAAHGRHLRTSVEAHRRGRQSGRPELPRISNGHLVWKLNATWPHLYSNILDYYLEPYIPFYELKRAYSPVQLSFDIGDHIWLWLANDSAEDVHGTYRAVLFNVGSNAVEKEVTGSCDLAAGQSSELTDLDAFGQFDEERVLFAEVVDSKGVHIAGTIDFVCLERYMRFPEPRLELELEDGTLYVSTDVFAKSVELTGNDDGDEFGWLFSDNYFDLMPWERKAVAILGDHSRGTITAKGYYSPHITNADFAR